MKKSLARAAAVVMIAALAACGGGGDDEVVEPVPSLELDGSYSVACYPVLGGDTPVSARSYLDIDGLDASSSDYYFLGSSCNGDAFASVTYLTAQLSARGTKLVPGPNGIGSVTALKVLVSTFGEPVRASGSVRLTPSGATFEVLYPNSTLVVESYAARQDNNDSPDILAMVGTTLYFGDDDAPVDANGYTVALDYTFGWLLR